MKRTTLSQAITVGLVTAIIVTLARARDADALLFSGSWIVATTCSYALSFYVNRHG